MEKSITPDLEAVFTHDIGLESLSQNMKRLILFRNYYWKSLAKLNQEKASSLILDSLVETILELNGRIKEIEALLTQKEMNISLAIQVHRVELLGAFIFIEKSP